MNDLLNKLMLDATAALADNDTARLLCLMAAAQRLDMPAANHHALEQMLNGMWLAAGKLAANEMRS